jgi:hypothetical protein
MGISSTLRSHWAHTWSLQHHMLDHDAKSYIVGDASPKALYLRCVLGGIDPSNSVGRPVTVSVLPRSVNIWIRPFCAFLPSPVVRIELRNTTSNKLIHQRTERQEPYYLFGDLLDSTGKFKVSSGSIPSGSYSILTFINNFQSKFPYLLHTSHMSTLPSTLPSGTELVLFVKEPAPRAVD